MDEQYGPEPTPAEIEEYANRVRELAARFFAHPH